MTLIKLVAEFLDDSKLKGTFTASLTFVVAYPCLAGRRFPSPSFTVDSLGKVYLTSVGRVSLKY